MAKGRRISLISKLNYLRLVYRSLLLASVVVYYVLARVYGIPFFDFSHPATIAVVGFVTLSFIVEMVERFIPTKTSSMGSQKQFKRNYVPSGEEKPELQGWKTTLAVFLCWATLNGVFAILYYFGIFDQGIMLIIASVYSVCDMICILFFCPFQTWIMHNRCCGTCRIYNWDFAMMFTPLIFVAFAKGDSGVTVNPFALVLVALSLTLLLEWEIIYHRHPERFSDATNMSLRCEHCSEKLCAHKKHLQHLLREWRKAGLLVLRHGPGGAEKSSSGEKRHQ